MEEKTGKVTTTLILKTTPKIPMMNPVTRRTPTILTSMTNRTIDTYGKYRKKPLPVFQPSRELNYPRSLHHEVDQSSQRSRSSRTYV